MGRGDADEDQQRPLRTAERPGRPGALSGRGVSSYTMPSAVAAAVASAVASAAASAAASVADLLLPRTCVCCDSSLGPNEHRLLCGLCIQRVSRLPSPQCDRCGHPNLVGECRWCELLPPFVRAARSVCWVPGGRGGDIVHKFKYSGWTALAEPMAEQMARLNFPSDVAAERDMLVPVPLAQSRARERGYNQSRLLAERLAAHWNTRVVDAIARQRSTETQTRLTAGDRVRNVAGAFAVTIDFDSLAGKHVLLVDDVVTTAATLNACARVLHEAGARIISYVTFGRARAAGDLP